MKEIIKVTIILFAILLIACNKGEEMKEGEIYLHSFNWNEEDPFKEIEIDTIKIILIRGKYAKWMYRYETDRNFCMSGKKEDLKDRIKPLEQ